jgi:hypothetical protein
MNTRPEFETVIPMLGWCKTTCFLDRLATVVSWLFQETLHIFFLLSLKIPLNTDNESEKLASLLF